MAPVYVLVAIVFLVREASSCSCPNAWTVYGESCYFHGHDAVNFVDAERFCQHRHSHLVHINNAAENNFIKSLLSDVKYDKHWIGLTDQDIENVWQWYDTDTSATFTSWGNGQPNNGLVSNCGAIWASFGYNWVDEPCTNLFQPLCEQPSPKS